MGDRAPQLALVPAEPGSDEQVPLSRRTDDELMLLARAGLREAFDTIVARHQSQALRVAARRLRQPSLAADVAQRTFLDLYRALHRYQARNCFPAYMYRALLNRCRIAEREARSERRFILPLWGPTVHLALEVSTPVASAESLLLAHERERDVHHALARLSVKLRDVVSLRFGADLSYQEIAQTLNLPVGTVKRRVFDAMEKLRRIMEKP
jgi:RNA polymerase sigma-70 factor (ECF subfamily)